MLERLVFDGGHLRDCSNGGFLTMLMNSDLTFSSIFLWLVVCELASLVHEFWFNKDQLI